METIERPRKLPVRKPGPSLEQIRTICFRVTRSCNLSCHYCQAPPTPEQQDGRALKNALTWLAANGCKSVKFTGGEPMISPVLPELIQYCRQLKMAPTVVTNGTILDRARLACLAEHAVRVKISLHGPSTIHDALQGQPVFEKIMRNISAMLAAGVEVSIHTLLTRDSELDLSAWTQVLCELGIHKVSYMPFIARGRGADIAATMMMSSVERQQRREQVDELATGYAGRIVVRWLDFEAQPYVVFETDGTIHIQHGDPEQDQVAVRRVTANGH